MITIDVQNFNNFSQEFYDSVVNAIELHQLKCSCNHSACMNWHGSYKRSIITGSGKTTLRIMRVICTVCGKTHAILPASVVPYSQIPAEVQRQAVRAYEKGTAINVVCDNSGIDENNVKSIILRYRRFWRERLLSERIGLGSIKVLIRRCLENYGMSFMQIKKTVNRLFSLPT